MRIDKVSIFKGSLETVIEIYYDKNRPYAILDGQRYDGYVAGEIIQHESITNPNPIPNGMIGFVIEDYIFMIMPGLGRKVMIANPGYRIVLHPNKRDNIIWWSIATVLLALFAFFIIYYAIM